MGQQALKLEQLEAISTSAGVYPGFQESVETELGLSPSIVSHDVVNSVARR